MYPLGRIVEHDPRSREYPHVAMAKQVQTVLWPHSAGPLDQGQVGSCTGNALAQWFNTDVNVAKTGKTLTEQDALAFYEAATRVDNIPGHYLPDDTGSSGLAVCKAVKRMGMLSGYRWAFSFQALLQALQSGPVITGTVWHEGMFTPDSQGFLKPTGAVAGGHEYLILGADLEHDYLTMLNSWGPDWGHEGRAKISFVDYQKLQSEQGDVTIPQL